MQKGNMSIKRYEEVVGDLIELALMGMFGVIVHGCNCFCRMKRGIAVEMDKVFKCNSFPLEDKKFIGDINKLGQIEKRVFLIDLDSKLAFHPDSYPLLKERQVTISSLFVVNAYTQYKWSTKEHTQPFDYDAFRLCMRKLNYRYPDSHIGMPKIGAGLAGGDWEKIKQIIQEEMTSCYVTVVIKK